MRLVKDDVIDFEKYLQADSEAAWVRPAGHWYDEVMDRFRNGRAAYGARLPWVGVRDLIRLRPAELSIWAGVNGHGKSLILSQVALDLMAQGEKVCIASMEMRPDATMYRLARQSFGDDGYTDIRLQKLIAALDQDLLWIYDQQGTVKSDRILALGRYCRERLNVNHLIVDSLMKCGIGVDDYNGQKSYIDKLCALAKDTGLHIHLVAHSRKGRTEDERIGKFDIKGASEITDQADNVFTLWRNKPKERLQAAADHTKDEEPDAILSCDKQRHGEWEGQIKLWYRLKSMQYTMRDLRPQTYDLSPRQPGSDDEPLEAA